MRLTRVKIAGFKSFVDPTNAPFPTNLTGIVGPNGCGKSNLVEALRWAMGETSHKSLRAADMDAVIFAGSGNRPARNHAATVAGSPMLFGQRTWSIQTHGSSKICSRT